MKQLRADVAIISAGTAGLAAAIAAGEKGASVIALEKSNHTGGTAIMGNGLFAVESRLQRLKQYPLTREDAFKIYMDFVRLAADARLVKAVIDLSADTIDWLEGMGVEFWDLGGHGYGMNYTWHLVKGTAKPAVSRDTAVKKLGPGLGNAATMMQKMTERAERLGVRILLKTPVKKIIKEGERIAGVLAEDSSGDEVRVEAKAVIIATGGYGGHFPAHPGLEGEGIRMAREVGAYAVDREALPKQAGGPPMGGGRRSIARAVASVVNSCFSQPNLMVNLMGERFIDEELAVTSLFSSNAMSRQKGGCAFNIFDEDMKNFYVEKGFDFIGGYGIAQMGDPPCKATGFDEELAQILEQSPDRIIVADSIAELAARLGIDPEALNKTIEEYNRACDTGWDSAYGKKARYLNPVKKPRFYASRVGSFPGGGVGPEGIKINYKTEVLSMDYTVIPGLYAAGIDAACNIYTGIYPNVMPGIAMGFAVNSGRMAGENAAEYIKENRE